MMNKLSKDVTFISSLFEGRATRKQYWFSAVRTALLTFLTSYATIESVRMSTVSVVISIILLTIIILAVIVIEIASSVRRCHDRNRNGWYFLLSLVPLANLWLFIELGFLRGTVGDNEYGPDPLLKTDENSYLEYKNRQTSDFE